MYGFRFVLAVNTQDSKLKKNKNSYHNLFKVQEKTIVKFQGGYLNLQVL